VPEWKERDKTLFVDRVKAQVDVHRSAGSRELQKVVEIYARALRELVTLRKDEGKLPDAMVHLEAIGAIPDADANPTVKRWKAETGELRAGLKLAKADALGDDSPEAVTLYREVLAQSQGDSCTKAMKKLIERGKARADYENKIKDPDPEVQVGALDGVLGFVGNPPDGATSEAKGLLADIVRQRDTLKGDLISLSFGALAVPWSGPAYASDLGSIRAEIAPSGGPAGSGRTVDKPGGKRLYIKQAGTYEVRVFAAEESRYPVALWLEVRLKKGESLNLLVPVKIPRGMVYLGPWQEGGAKHGGFFADRTELTVGDARATGVLGRFAPVEAKANDLKDPAQPLWGVTEDAARALAQALKKAIPTDAQWLDMAYGPAALGLTYPWKGSKCEPGKHAEAGRGKEQPSAVGSMPEGASPFGILDLIGNESEWVERPVKGTPHLWALGGSYYDPAPVPAAAGKRTLLRDPRPGPKAQAAVEAVDQSYADYRCDKDADYYDMGVRFVVPL